jgi:hypothetical protein
MTPSSTTSNAVSTVPRRARSPRSAGRAAFAWAVIFALMSLYWAAGGLLAGETLGVEIDRLAHERDASFVAGLWAAFALKAAAATLALALIQPWGRRLPRRLLLGLGWATGAGITLYAAANLVQHSLMAIGAIDTPDALGTHAVAWHLALWDPIWLVGGLLFLLAARGSRLTAGWQCSPGEWRPSSRRGASPAGRIRDPRGADATRESAPLAPSRSAPRRARPDLGSAREGSRTRSRMHGRYDDPRTRSR